MTDMRETFITKESLKQAMEQCGVRPGMILEAHCSLSSLPFVIGGARTIVDALMEEEKDGGTVVMCTGVPMNSDPSTWNNPPIPASNWNQIREAMPAYDPEKTDLPADHEVEDNFRHREGIVCSSHPSCSYTAWGRYAKLLCNRQSVHFPLAEESPAARLYEMKGYFLLIGCDLSASMTMCLSRYRTESEPVCIHSACTNEDGKAEWKKYLDLENMDAKAYQEVEKILVRKELVKSAALGDSIIQLMPIHAAVDEMTAYLASHSVYDLYR